jgi:hypothetical protein
VVVYADNFLLMAKTHNEAMSMFNTLKLLLEEHPAGPLSLKLEWDSAKHPTFEFLGYMFDTVDGLSITPTDENRAKFERKARNYLRRYQNEHLTLARRQAALKKLKQHIKSWTSAFGCSPQAEAIRQKWEAKIQITDCQSAP